MPRLRPGEGVQAFPEYRWYHNITLNAYWFGTSFMWNSLHPIILPTLLLSLVPENAKNTGYGLLTFAGLMVALVMEPVSGALSDGSRHRLGRRRPWVLAGTFLGLVCLLPLALANSLWMVAVGYVLLQFASNLAHGAGQGLIPDIVPQGKRGIASGIKYLIDMAGVICAALVAGHLMGGGHPRPLLAVGVVACVLLGAMTITVVGSREVPTSRPGKARPRGRAGLAQLRQLLKVNLRGQRDYARLLAARYCVLLGTYSVQSFGLFYFHDALQMPDAPTAVGKVMAAVALSVTLITFPAGVLSEVWGRKGLSLAACAITAVGMGLLLPVRSMTALLALGCTIGVGMGIFASVTWAWATDLVPSAEAGKYLGLSNLATAGSAATARLLGPVVDLVNARRPYVGYSIMFIVATIGALLGLVILIGVPDKGAAMRSRGETDQASGREVSLGSSARAQPATRRR
ncbi:MAG TPA: MFS transporter [Anaerolineae bacterium]|nr:MFS transporter [Anaerolineae bacterium]